MPERQLQRRLALEDELNDLARTDPEVASVVNLLPAAQELLPNSEDHNLLADHRLHAASRKRWLAIGALLHERSLVSTPDDIFYFTREELVDTLEGRQPPRREELGARRSVLEAARSAVPPPVLGKPLSTSEDFELGVDLATDPSKVRVLRGVGASRGSYRGTARVIEALEDAANLLEGDILVCRSTTPPWSPFFGLISALVTNSGSLLSHGAVVAREFGLPAVVGTINGTALIPDGATITVDGTNGLVIIEQ